MDAGPSELRSGRRQGRMPRPSKAPETSGAAAEAPGSPIPRDTSASLFSCGVCQETARDPVVTLCGHIFCWPCLYRSIRGRRRRSPGACPVCKSAVAVETGDVAGVTPIYGIDGDHDGGSGGGGDGGPSPEVPPRPRGLQEASSEGEEMRELREGLHELSRDVDALEERMWRVMASMAQLRVPVLIAYAAEIARRNAAAAEASSAAAGGRRRRRRNGSDGGGDGVYRGTRSRRRQANL